MTLNLGLRYDYITMGFPAADLPAGPYVPARHVDKLSGVPIWKDVNPRLGVAYDVFGNGRTAIKFSMGRFNQLSRSDMTRRFHPFTSSVSSAYRNWTDTNGDYIPDCDLANFSANGECGAISNQFFGQFIPSATIFDDSVIKDNRDFLWDYNLEVDHEILHGLAVNVAYNHNADGSFIVSENTLYGPEAFDEFCITVPNDSRLPNAGQEQCGYYDLKPQFFGKGQTRVTNAKEFGKQKRYWDGFTFGAEGRLPHGVNIGGGLDIGRQVDDHCYTVDVPNQPADINGTPLPGGPFCRNVTSWGNLADFRVRGSVPIRGGVTASLIYRNTPGSTNNAVMTVVVRACAVQGSVAHDVEHRAVDLPVHAELGLRRSLPAARPVGEQVVQGRGLGAPARSARRLQRAERQLHPEHEQHVWGAVLVSDGFPERADRTPDRNARVLIRWNAGSPAPGLWRIVEEAG